MLSTGGDAQCDAGEAAIVVLSGVLGERGNSPRYERVSFGSERGVVPMVVWSLGGATFLRHGWLNSWLAGGDTG
jgi:hypothetical protein